MGLTKLVALLAAIAAVSSQAVESNGKGRILGGVNARFGEFPHLCSVTRTRPILADQHVGGGNILNNRWILTAASIVPPPGLLNSYEVICGRSNLGLAFEPTEQRVRVQTIYRHPQFAGLISPNDIALIHLGVQLNFGPAVQAINLPIVNAIPAGIASLVGWGGTDDAWIGQSFGVLQLSRVPILPDIQCVPQLNQWGIFNTVTHFCTGPLTGGMSPCDTDSGSSLLTRVGTVDTIIGLVSLPQACGNPGRAGTYTRVSAFNAWILATMF